ncbi:MAG: hypothetical protein OIF32_05240 [Campylobacterales bacterium]|nr:hypothetical protein [Campylobacterales bacterium]
MTKKTSFLFYSYVFLFLAFALTIFLIERSQFGFEEKQQFVKTVGLPDLAISTEAAFVRHRSLADLFSVFKDSPELTEYYPSTFSTNHGNFNDK